MTHAPRTRTGLRPFRHLSVRELRSTTALLLLLTACAQPTLTLTPTTPTTLDPLQAHYAGPLPGSITLRWSVAGETSVEGPLLPAALTAKGQTWQVDALRGDRTLVSASVTILNTPPILPTPTLVPAAPRPGDLVSCLGAPDDPDEDPLDTTLRWWFDGQEAGNAPTLLVPIGARTLRCELTVSDGEATTSAEVMTEVDRTGFDGNLLVLIADDLGVDKVSGYQQHEEAPPTPVLDQLMAEGAWYSRAYASPVCSPSRAALLTGRQTHRYDIGAAISRLGFWGLALDELTLPEALELGTDAAYTSVGLGKWHLNPPSFLGEEHPLLQGFQSFTGALYNLNDVNDDGTTHSYHRWPKWDGSTWQITTRYVTTDTVDDAIALLATLPEPWLLYVGFNAPHAPFEPPPPDLYQGEVTADSPDAERYSAVVQALDTELGRLLAALDGDLADRTTVVFAGDNGTPKSAVLPPLDKDHAKGTPHEGGIRVPLIVRGPLVADPGVPRDQLVHVMDLFPTLLELAGVDPPTLLPHLPDQVIDGVSLLPTLRDAHAPAPQEMVVSLAFRPSDPSWREAAEQVDLAVRDDRYKLIRPLEGPDQLYELGMAAVESPPLDLQALSGEEQLALERLQLRADAFPRPPPLP
jgi:arylsulfatase A-like enzyme